MKKLYAIEKGILIITDFEAILEDTNMSISFNQRRDFFAQRPITLICFLPNIYFKEIATLLPDWWSIRSLELDLTTTASLETIKLPKIQLSSLGGDTLIGKQNELKRLLKELEIVDKTHLKLINSLYTQVLRLCLDLRLFEIGLRLTQDFYEIAEKNQYQKYYPDTMSEIYTFLNGFHALMEE